MNWWGKLVSSKRNIAIFAIIILVLLVSGLAIAKGSLFKIFANPEGRSGSLHVILEQSNSGMGGAGFLKNGAPAGGAGTWSGHTYNVESLPFGDYQIQMQVPGVPSNPVPCIGPWYPLSHYSTDQSFTYPPFECSLANQTATPTLTPARTPAPTLPQYKITGNVRGRNPNGQGGSDLLATAKIELIEKNPIPSFTYTTAITGSGTYSGKNYLSNKFGANIFDRAYLEFSAPGYQPLELKFLDTGVVASTTLVGEGNITFDLKTIKDVTLVQSTGKLDIQGLVTDGEGALVPGASVTTGCPTYPTNMLEPCKPKLSYPNYPFNSSRSDPQTTHNNRQNYLIPNVYDFYDETSFDHIVISVLPPAGYYVDQDENGEQGDTELAGRESYFNINKSDIKSDGVFGHNTYALKDIKLIKLPDQPTATIKGRLYRLPLSQQKVGIKGTINLQKENGDLLRAITTNNDGTYEAKLSMADLVVINSNLVVKGKYTAHESVTDRNIDFGGCYSGTGYPRRTTADGCAILHLTAQTYENIDVLIKLDSVQATYTLITGYVRDKATRRPIEGAFVSIRQGASYLETAPGKTDASGYYEIIAQLPGGGESNPYQLKAIKSGYSDDGATVKQITMQWGGVYKSVQTDYLLNKCP